MMKKIRSFFYLLGQGFIGVFRNSIMTTASVLVLVCCMLVMGTFGLVVKVIEKNFEQVDDLNVIVAYLDKELDETAISSLQTQIENMRNVTEVRFVSKEQALERLKEKMGEDDFLSYYGDEMNPLPDSFEIAFSDPDQAHLLLNSVEKLDGIDSTSDKISLVERVSLITGGLMIIAWIMMAVLLVVSLFVIMNTIKLGVFARKSEITIMRYVGATGAFGALGIVGASGSGAQEVGCLVEKLGFGISSLIGTGGRDLYPEIGGIMMLEGISRLERDPDTKIIILVSKLADLTVMNKVLSFADIVSKPVVAIFLGADEKLYEGHRVYGTFSLEGAAVKAAQLLGAKTHDFGFTDEQIKEIVAREMRGYSAKQKYFRGLYCGGTFTEEGLIYYSSHVKNARLHSNLNTAYAEKLASHLHSEGHSILDLGSEEFTACSPHPVFDPEIRLKRFRQELQDDEVAVILLDFITGPGVAKEPVKEFAIEAKKAIAEKHITVISNICGSAEDPQNIELQAKMLRDAGVIVTDSNYQSARLAAALMSALNERG